MNINQKAIRLLQQIVNGRKEYRNGHFVYKPQLEADVVNKLYAEFLVEYCKLKDYHSKLRSFSASISRCSNGIYPGTGRITGEIRNNIYDFVSPEYNNADKALRCSASAAQSEGRNIIREKEVKKWYESREGILKRWDIWRRYFSSGGKSSWPRDEFESLLDYLLVQQSSPM